MAQYGENQMQQAVQAGLISQDDANQLLKQLDPGNSLGSIAGAELGALADGAAGGGLGRVCFERM